MLLGTAGGVAMTLFTAPCSGEETIDRLRRRANRLLGRVEDTRSSAYDWSFPPAAEVRQDWHAEVDDLAGLAQDIPDQVSGQQATPDLASGEPRTDELQQIVDAFQSTPVGREVADELADIAQDMAPDSSHPSAEPRPPA
jgi:gas vesicle protein